MKLVEGWASDPVRLDEAVEAKSDITAARVLTLLSWSEDGAGAESDGGSEVVEFEFKLIELFFEF